MEIASSPEHKMDVFKFLKEECKYQQAQMAFEYMNLAAFGAVPISQEEFLKEKDLDLYLKLPLNEEVIMF